MAHVTSTICRLLLFLLVTTPCHALTRFRFAVCVYPSMNDFGWSFHLNVARINLQKYLTSTYPNVLTEHTIGNVLQTWNSDCDPQYEAWVQEGYNLIIGAMGDTWCLAKLATWYPNVTFVTVAGFPAAPPNYASVWTRLYQGGYMAGYTAGLTTKRKKVCVSAGTRIPLTVMDISGFCRGVHSADPTVEVHILETGALENHLLEEWSVNQSYALGCDIVFVSSLAVVGCLQASRLGMMCIGWFTDARLTVGELVITSAYVDFTPMFIRTAEATMNGTFATERLKPDWWMGWEWRSIKVGEPSLFVPASANAKLDAQAANLSRVFCGRVCTKSRCLCNSSACCLTDSQLNALTEFPDFAIEHGTLQLPGRSCQAGQLGTWHVKFQSVNMSLRPHIDKRISVFSLSAAFGARQFHCDVQRLPRRDVCVQRGPGLGVPPLPRRHLLPGRRHAVHRLPSRHVRRSGGAGPVPAVPRRQHRRQPGQHAMQRLPAGPEQWRPHAVPTAVPGVAGRGGRGRGRRLRPRRRVGVAGDAEDAEAAEAVL
eukprot:EG_transcript_9157